MSMKLRELIRAVRACKTAAEERAVISRENAMIRTSFKEDSPYRHRNVAKLLYIHMLGYPTHHGQLEALKLIAGGNFPEKRIGYLGLMLLLDERQEVLMLVTNSLEKDMDSRNPYIVGLALCSLGNICSAEMARDLCSKVETFFRHTSAYIRKKAALCATRIIRKVPELREQFEKSVLLLLNDKNHAVLLTAVTLIIDMCKIDESVIKRYRKPVVPVLVRLLKNLVLAGYVSEYDVAGITDPFLQSKLIQLLRVLGTGNTEASEFMYEILAQVAINTEPTKNPGNVILYECVQTIMAIEADTSSRVLAINILGRFLANRDNNIRYVALASLCKCVGRDTAAVQRHRNTIVECFPEVDTRVLTNYGFLFLNQIEEKQAAGLEVLFGCYDVASKEVQYSTGELVIRVKQPRNWVEFTSNGEAEQWDDASGPYGRIAARKEDIRSKHVSLRVTPDHIMFVQTGNKNITKKGTANCDWSSTRSTDPVTKKRGKPVPKPHREMEAHKLLSECDCPPPAAGKPDCKHRRALLRVFAYAHTGYAPPKAATAQRRAVQRALHLDATQFTAFFELFGFWLGDGSMQYRRGGSGNNAVAFSQVKQSDRDWLRVMFAKVGLQASQLRSFEPGIEEHLHVVEPAWFDLFDKEFGRKYLSSPRWEPASAAPSTARVLESSVSRSLMLRDSHVQPAGINLDLTRNYSISFTFTPRGRSTSAVSTESMSDASATAMELEDEPLEEDDMDDNEEEDVDEVKVKDEPMDEDDGEDEDEDEEEDDDMVDDLEDKWIKSVKWLPDWTLAELSRDEMRLLIAGLHRADGSFKGKVKEILTSSDAFRDQLIQAMLHCGYSAYGRPMYRAGTIRGYKLKDAPKERKLYTTKYLAKLSATDKLMYKPVVATVDSWAVSWCDSDGKNNKTGKGTCQPPMLRQQCVRAVPYAQRDGRAWCVDVDHDDHLLIAQRAERNERTDYVTKQSRPIIVGNCLKDVDVSIRRRALDLIYALVTKSNVKTLAKELLTYLALTTGDNEFKTDLTDKICVVVDRYAPSKHWHVETIIAVLTTAGSLTKENVATDLILLILKNPTLHPYAVFKLFFAIRNGSPHLPLIHVALWCIGEYGDYLVSNHGVARAREVDDTLPQQPVTERDVVDVLRSVSQNKDATLLTKEYLLMALIKLSSRLQSSEVRSELSALVATYESSRHVELQQRSVEYVQLSSEDKTKLRNGLVGRMPVPTKPTKKQRETEAKEQEEERKRAAREKGSGKKKKKKAETSEEEEESEEESEASEGESEEEETEEEETEEEEDDETKKKQAEVPKPNGKVKKVGAQKPQQNLFDTDFFAQNTATSTSPSPTVPFSQSPTPRPPVTVDLLSDIFGSAAATAAMQRPPPQAADLDPFAALNTSSPTAARPTAAPSPSLPANTAQVAAAPPSADGFFPSTTAASANTQTFPPATVFDKDGLSVTFLYSRSPATPATLHVTALFSNRTAADFTSFDFQVAVARNAVTLTMQPASSAVVPANSEQRVRQELVLNNSMHGQKRLVIKVKITYSTDGRQVVETATISQFPD